MAKAIIVRKQDEYRQNATDAIESARTATSEAARKRFLDLAKMWTEGAEHLDDAPTKHLRD